MMDWAEAYWIAIVAVLLLAFLLAWWVWGRSPAERVRSETPDVLSPGAAPADRNTLLVEAPPAAAIIPPSVSVGMVGMGEVIAIGASQALEDGTAADAPAPQEDGPSPAADVDDLTRIKGVGPKLKTLLGQLGVTRYDQIAGWSDADIARIDPQLGAFQGRIGRDNWIEQCRYLAAGDLAGYEAKFGKV